MSSLGLSDHIYHNSDPEEPIDIDHTSLLQFSPGEEGIINSHAGAELFEKILDSLLAHNCHQADDQVWSQCVQKAVDAWEAQCPALVRGYLTFKACGPPNNETRSEEWPLSVMNFTVNEEQLFFHASNTKSVNETLIHYSIDGLSWTLQYLHKLPHELQLEDQLQVAYNEYLVILREVNKLTLGALD
ncbi:hypothetical protein Moror_8578 [Moniliophthora roreri MCA 2997]|uniref:Uncharacterized protein n=1 Tax=Moniliophthora roreri (strain MCA 2997) TaxID=1381753 RepID=V2WPG4_MONRO|nr:hypothetical protein Moror_8578 [Moniliophthora roreri MCA 2997]